MGGRCERRVKVEAGKCLRCDGNRWGSLAPWLLVMDPARLRGVVLGILGVCREVSLYEYIDVEKGDSLKG